MAEPIPKTMRGVLLVGHGGQENLEFRTDLPVPRPQAGEVLVRVSASAVNNTDINTRIGWYSKSGEPGLDAAWTGEPLGLPRIQGADACGRIAAVGAGVAEARLGERVLIEPCLREARAETLAQPCYLGSECDGGFAEYLVVAARHAVQVKSDLSDTELATFPCSSSTAENLLGRARVVAGDRVLITGASGGVGVAALQLVLARGGIPVAQAAPEKASALEALGAEVVVARDADLALTLGHNAVDVVVDLVGGARWPALLEVLRPHGRYAVSGAIAGAEVALDLRTLYLKDLTFFGCTVLDSDTFRRLIGRIGRGEIQPVVASTYPLERLAEAQTEFLAKKHIGKIAISIAA